MATQQQIDIQLLAASEPTPRPTHDTAAYYRSLIAKGWSPEDAAAVTDSDILHFAEWRTVHH